MTETTTPGSPEAFAFSSIATDLFTALRPEGVAVGLQFNSKNDPERKGHSQVELIAKGNLIELFAQLLKDTAKLHGVTLESKIEDSGHLDGEKKLTFSINNKEIGRVQTTLRQVTALVPEIKDVKMAYGQAAPHIRQMSKVEDSRPLVGLHLHSNGANVDKVSLALIINDITHNAAKPIADAVGVEESILPENLMGGYLAGTLTIPFHSDNVQHVMQNAADAIRAQTSKGNPGS